MVDTGLWSTVETGSFYRRYIRSGYKIDRKGFTRVKPFQPLLLRGRLITNVDTKKMRPGNGVVCCS